MLVPLIILVCIGANIAAGFLVHWLAGIIILTVWALTIVLATYQSAKDLNRHQ